VRATGWAILELADAQLLEALALRRSDQQIGTRDVGLF
jgi:hypothetical protein